VGIFEESDPKAESNAEDLVRAANSVLLHDAVLLSMRRAWLLSFGASRDGFAASVTVIDGGEKSRVWCEDTASFERALERVVAAATEVEGEVPPEKPKRAQKRK